LLNAEPEWRLKMSAASVAKSNHSQVVLL
jgi:hypothetical protein